MKILLSLLIMFCAECFSHSAAKLNEKFATNHGARSLQRNRAEIWNKGRVGARIRGGIEAGKNEFPWIVHFTAGNLFCGGTLIRLDTVLTAAHCFTGDISNTIVTVVAGDHSIGTNEDTEQSLNSSWIKIHEQYNNKSFLNDIALIKLVNSFDITEEVRAIGLSRFSEKGLTGTVAGWGITETGDWPDKLQKVDIPIVTCDTCSRAAINQSLQICAGTTGKDASKGDSGGPLICHNSPETLCGIVSCGCKCGKPNCPGVYTFVSAYRTWIEEHTETPEPSSAAITTSLLINVSLSFVFLVLFSVSTYPTFTWKKY